MKLTFDTTKLKEQAEDNPLVVGGIIVAALSGVSKLMNANTARKNSNTYAREIKRREKNSK